MIVPEKTDEWLPLGLHSPLDSTQLAVAAIVNLLPSESVPECSVYAVAVGAKATKASNPMTANVMMERGRVFMQVSCQHEADKPSEGGGGVLKIMYRLLGKNDY